MRTEGSIGAAKVIAVVGFAILLLCTYGLRSEVLKLNRTRFSADEAITARQLERFKETYSERVAAHELELRQYELERAHFDRQLEYYNRLVEVAERDLDEYARLVKDGGLEFPPMPKRPRLPSAPEGPGMRDRLAEINAQFAAQRFRYFDMTAKMNWLACLGALMLVSGLLSLVMFDRQGPRLFYFLILVLSFVFLIGPAFHSILSGIVGFLEMPS